MFFDFLNLARSLPHRNMVELEVVRDVSLVAVFSALAAPLPSALLRSE